MTETQPFICFNLRFGFYHRAGFSRPFQTVNHFRETIRLSGLQIDWYGNAGKPFVNLDSEALKKEGIFLHSYVPEAELIASARKADFAVIPAGTLENSDTHDWLGPSQSPLANYLFDGNGKYSHDRDGSRRDRRSPLRNSS